MFTMTVPGSANGTVTTKKGNSKGRLSAGNTGNRRKAGNKEDRLKTRNTGNRVRTGQETAGIGYEQETQAHCPIAV